MVSGGRLNRLSEVVLAKVSLAGAPQFISAIPRDRGSVRGPGGISLDDPDRDGCVEEISEGDLDLIEWYQLNHPAPARGRITKDVVAGERLFHKAGCAKCHVPDWHLFAHNPGAKDYTGRFDASQSVEIRPRVSGQLVDSRQNMR